MAVPLEKFVQQLEDSGIVAGDTLKDFLPPKASPQSAEDLAKELVRNKKLTKFQAEEVSRGKGKSLMVLLLNNLPEPDHRTIEAFNEEYRDCVFQWAADRIRNEFRDSIWNAFWRTSVLNEPVSDVAEDLEMTCGYVYVARSRVMARLKQLIQEFEDETNEGPGL